MERAVRAGVARHQVAEWILHRLGEGLGHAHRNGCAERVAQATGILDRRPALLAGDAHADSATRLLQRREIVRGRPARDGLVGRQVSHRTQQVVHRVRPVGVSGRCEARDLVLDVGE